jgi:hypothetical protein
LEIIDSMVATLPWNFIANNKISDIDVLSFVSKGEKSHHGFLC